VQISSHKNAYKLVSPMQFKFNVKGEDKKREKVVKMQEVFCGRCHQKVSSDNVRYAPDGKSFICSACSQAKTQDRQKTVERENFQCSRCSYKFSVRKESRLVRKCPYCASEKITLRDGITSSRMLNDVAMDF